MTGFIIKLIAMTTMVIDHVGSGFFNTNVTMRCIGRLAFVSYAFLMAESYCHLKAKPDRLRFHEIKLILLCIAAEIPFDYYFYGTCFHPDSQSTMFLLWLGFSTLIALGWWNDLFAGNRLLEALGSMVIILLALVLTCILECEYRIAGILLIVLFYSYLKRADDWDLWIRLTALFGVIAVYLAFHLWVHADYGGIADIISYGKERSYRIVGSMLTILPLALYNRKQGYKSVWFSWLYSIFYPLQFLLLIMVRHLVS